MPLLGPADPPAVELLPATRPDRPLLLVCDHAGHRLPQSLGNFGLSDADCRRHIAWDPGAAALTRALAARLGVGAVLSVYSRLVVDLNRRPGDPSSMPELADGTAIAGNCNLSLAERRLRIDELFQPYHQAIDLAMAELWWRNGPPLLLSVHSFTPCLCGGTPRPWQVGLLWAHDARLADVLRAGLQAGGDCCVADNQPYPGLSTRYTSERHAGAAGLAHLTLEMRQDQLADEAGVQRWAERLAAILEPALHDPDLRCIRHV